MRARFGNPLTNSSEGIGNFCKYHIFVRGFPIPSDPLLEGIDNSSVQLAEGIRYPLETFARRLPINKEQGNLFAVPQSNLKVKMKIQEETIIRGSSSNQTLSSYKPLLARLNLVGQYL
jgi:hypothetical protein